MTRRTRRGPSGALPNYCVAAACANAADHLQAAWQATSGHMGRDLPRRLDAFWTTRPHALCGYQVLDTPAARLLSDHFPIRVGLDPAALDSGDTFGPVLPPAGAGTLLVAGS